MLKHELIELILLQFMRVLLYQLLDEGLCLEIFLVVEKLPGEADGGARGHMLLLQLGHQHQEPVDSQDTIAEEQQADEPRGVLRIEPEVVLFELPQIEVLTGRVEREHVEELENLLLVALEARGNCTA